jgi:ribonucleotide monophosphatase NagD (HAD superfamily)
MFRGSIPLNTAGVGRTPTRCVLEDVGGPPRSSFVGDRQQVDLKIAQEAGIPTLLVRETADLLQVLK